MLLKPTFCLSAVTDLMRSNIAFTGLNILEIRRHPAPPRITILKFTTSHPNRILTPGTSRCHRATYHLRRYRFRLAP
jgi:hypothetical protein